MWPRIRDDETDALSLGSISMYWHCSGEVCFRYIVFACEYTEPTLSPFKPTVSQRTIKLRIVLYIFKRRRRSIFASAVISVLRFKFDEPLLPIHRVCQSPAPLTARSRNHFQKPIPHFIYHCQYTTIYLRSNFHFIHPSGRQMGL